MNVFSEDKDVRELVLISNELCDIGSGAGLLSWDQETYMPVKGASVRAFQLSTMAGIYHEKLTRKYVGDLIKRARGKSHELNLFDNALVREMRREFERATKLPNRMVKEISEATSRAFDTWQKAKKASDFSAFAPRLETLLELKAKAAKLLAKPGQGIYDTMLDDHEEGLGEAEVERVFDGVKERLSKLSRDLSVVTVGADEVITNRQYDVDAQWKLGMKILNEMGYDLDAGRQDKSAHPFTINFGVNDVRITTWEVKDDLRPMLFASIHEGGHALYEQGVNEALERTHLAGGQGLVVHESQSRLWENMVGRSGEFWEFYYAKLQDFLPQLNGVAREQFVRAVNVVKPSLVRVEADEVTYGLHIMVRFEIERDLVAGKIKVKDLPELWSKKMKKLLGVAPENDREGVLQDVHWSHGSFGYFPTYLLGTMTAAQIWHKIGKEREAEIKQGDLRGLREWLKENLHKHGRVYTSGELIQMVTGEKLNPEYFIEYLEKKFKKLYNQS